MTATLEITGNTVSANDVLMRLDALAKGYEEVLEQARKQLETFEISNEDWNRLADKLNQHIDFYDMAGKVNLRLGAALRDVESGVHNPDSEGAVRMLDMLTTRIEGRLRAVIAETVADVVREQTRDLRQRVIQDGKFAADELIERARRDALIETEHQKTALRSLLHHSLGDEFKRLALDAAREVATQS
jgi:cell division septum initiation protein DivIVA